MGFLHSLFLSLSVGVAVWSMNDFLQGKDQVVNFALFLLNCAAAISFASTMLPPSGGER